MYRKLIQHALVIAAVTAACPLSTNVTWAQKGNKPVGGGGGGGAAYRIVSFDAGDSASLRSQVNDLNEVGDVVGGVNHQSQFQSWHLDLAGGVYTPLPGNAVAVNNAGQIVGATLDGSDNPTVAYFLNAPGAVPVPLPPLDGDDESVATDINDAGIVIGFSRVDHTSDTTAVAWRPGIDENGMPFIDGPVALFPLAGNLWSYAGRINDSIGSTFLVVGDAWGSPAREAVVWSIELDVDGGLIPPAAPLGLGTLGLLAVGYSEGHAINAFGDVCGKSDLLPFVVSGDGYMQALPVPRDTQSGSANDINDLGEAVGQLDVHKIAGAHGTGWPEYHAHLWRNGGTVDLETMIDSGSGWDQLWGANRISNGGVIAGYGRFDVESRGFIMIPNK